MNILHPKTNISGNDLARSLDVIRSAEREHWFKGLQQSELEIRNLQLAMKSWGWLDKLRELLTGQKSPQKRDIEYQLSVCLKEYHRILDAHPEAISMTYEELQERYSGDALNARKATAIATHIIMRQFGIGEAAAHLLVSSSPEDLPAIIAGSAEISHATSQTMASVSGSSDATYAAALLASMPADQRRQVIVESQAIAALNQSGEY